jgi:hypothetical protein
MITIKKSLFVVFFVFFICVIFSNSKWKEGWTDKTRCDFEQYVKTYNPTYKFNLDIIQKYSNDEDVEYLLNNNIYKWREPTKKLFLDNVSKNKIIQINPETALNQAMNVYPEKAILQKLSWDTKEGNFLLYGSKLPDVKGTPPYTTNTAKCIIGNNGEAYMKKKIFTGINNLSGYQKCKENTIKNEELEDTIPGFRFVNEPCNPCSPLNNTPTYDCPFSLNHKGSNKPSSIWSLLWNGYLN